MPPMPGGGVPITGFFPLDDVEGMGIGMGIGIGIGIGIGGFAEDEGMGIPPAKAAIAAAFIFRT